MKRIIIRTLGGKGIGYGHYYRCLSLARAIGLIEKDIEITFIVNQELASLIDDTEFSCIVHNTLREDYNVAKRLSMDLFIMDTYLGNNEYLKKIKRHVKLMIIDDNNDIYDSTIPDIIYNGNIHANGLGYHYGDKQLRLLGTKYLLMKQEYWGEKGKVYANKEGVLITTGGTDEYGVILRMIQAMMHLNIKIKVILGPGFKNEYIKQIEVFKKDNIELIYRPESLKNYITSSHIVVTAGGSSVYEIIAQETTPVLFSIADNQDLICKSFREMGVEYLGKYPKIDYAKLIDILQTPEKKIANCNDEIFKLVSGNGAKLVAKKILSVI